MLDTPAFRLFYKAKIYHRKPHWSTTSWIVIPFHQSTDPEHQQSARTKQDPGDLEMSKTCWTHCSRAGVSCLWPSCSFLSLISLPFLLLLPPCLSLPLSFFLPSQACQCHPVALMGITQTCWLPLRLGITDHQEVRVSLQLGIQRQLEGPRNHCDPTLIAQCIDIQFKSHLALSINEGTPGRFVKGKEVRRALNN